MIKEDYVSFEVAKLLKEKGFDIECQCCYTPKGYIRNLLTDANNTKIQDFNSLTEFEYEGVGLKGWYGSISAPTLQTAMKWLREKGIIITIAYTMYSLHIIGSQMMFGFKVQNVQGELLLENTQVAYDSYEQAEMDAIKYSLENLN